MVPQDQKEAIDEVIAKVDKFFEAGDSDRLVLDGYNAFQRKLIYNTVRPRFAQDHFFHMETVVPKDKSDRDRTIVIMKVSKD